MPFTFSHPAIIIPLFKNKNLFSISGLIIGSMIPDFEYFIRMKVVGKYGHNLLGVLWFDLPLSILLLYIFHCIVRNSLIMNLPYFIRGKFISYINFNWHKYFSQRWGVVIFSIIIGVLSHILWDSFTHSNSYFVQRLSYLQESFFLSKIKIPIYKFLQHISTIIGGVIVLWNLKKIPSKDTTTRSKINIWYWLIIFCLAIIVMFLRFYSELNIKLYGNIIVSLITSFLIGLILTSLMLPPDGASISRNR